MSKLSIASVLDNPARRIPIYAMVKASAPTPAKDDELIEDMRAQRYTYRERIRQMNRMDSEAYELDIKSLAHSLRDLEEEIHREAMRTIFGDPYVLDLSGARDDAPAAAAML